MAKYYYENKLQNENLTAKPNVAWAADCTTLNLGQFQNLEIFLCIDIYTNFIVTYKYSKQTFNSNRIIKALETSIKKRFPIKPRRKVILHTDRGTQFSSQSYNNFVNKYQDYFVASMARENTPTDNAVAERFMRTFKEHKIDSLTIEENIQSCLLEDPNFNSFRAILNEYVRSLNDKPNRKSNQQSPHVHDLRSSTAAMLMVEPKYPKAFSERFKSDSRAPEVRRYRSETKQLVTILDEVAAKRAEVVDNTPFDIYEDNIALGIIDRRLEELYSLIRSHPEITREYVENAIEPLRDDLEEMNDNLLERIEEIKLLVSPKPKRQKQVLPLRDPLRKDLFPFFLSNAGNSFKYQKDLRRSQVRVAYTVLYYVGLRVNEIRHLTEKDLRDAISSSQFSVIHHKTRQPHIHILSTPAVNDLKNLESDFQIIFQKYKYKYLFGKDKPMHQTNLIKHINRDLKNTCQVANLPYNIKSHSFRINLISNLLKYTTVQNAADIIGHDDIRSTLSYKRYALNAQEIRKLLDQIQEDS